eukprot:663879-Hanusia_phi.AAC.5
MKRTLRMRERVEILHRLSSTTEEVFAHLSARDHNVRSTRSSSREIIRAMVNAFKRPAAVSSPFAFARSGPRGHRAELGGKGGESAGRGGHLDPAEVVWAREGGRDCSSCPVRETSSQNATCSRMHFRKFCVEAAVEGLKERRGNRSGKTASANAFELSVVVHAIADSFAWAAGEGPDLQEMESQENKAGWPKFQQSWDVVLEEIEFCVENKLLTASTCRMFSSNLDRDLTILVVASILSAMCKVPLNEKTLNVLLDSTDFDDWQFSSQAISLKMLTSLKTKCRDSSLRRKLEHAITTIRSRAVQALNENSSVEMSLVPASNLSFLPDQTHCHGPELHRGSLLRTDRSAPRCSPPLPLLHAVAEL